MSVWRHKDWNKRRTLLYLGNLIAGLSLPLAFAPFDFYPLVFIGLGVLFWSWLPQRDLSPVLCAYFFGLGLFGAGVPWIYVSMYQFGGVSLAIAIFLTVLFVFFLALYPALIGLLVRTFRKLPPLLLLTGIFPAAWVLMEWLRGWLFTGFPWLNLGYSQIDTPLGAYAPVAGVYAVSWVTALVAGLVVFLVSQKHNIKFRLIAVTSLVLIWLGGAVLLSADWTQPNGRTITATLVQGNVAQDQKWLPRQRQPTIEAYVGMTEQHWDSDLVVWPETAMPFYQHQGAQFLSALSDKAAQTQTDILLGIPILEKQSNRYYNSMISVGGQNETYHKRHLVPFGEFIPFKGLLGGLLDVLDIPMSDFSNGRQAAVNLNLAGEKMAISICYEDAFGEEVIEFLPQASVLVNASNDAWFGESVAPHQHLQIARMRSLETGRPMLRATNTGVTAFIDHRGALQAVLPQFEATSLTREVEPRQGATPYVIVGNYLIVILCIMLLIVLGIIQKQGKYGGSHGNIM